ncbi:MAG: ubiquinone/menaquinone biosynthesis methyltransferase [Candidatus Omnitrophica bacterium]|nr:ubiquinone/menaquinone biosynthesis methyltransferase [Candidatus Omnitrophota bacterium]
MRPSHIQVVETAAQAVPRLPRVLQALEPAEKRVVVQRLFSHIAPRYDWFNRLASFGLDQRWRKQAIALGEIKPGQRILDVCAGTGDLALLCARRLCGQGLIIGIDRNRDMLVRAGWKQRARRFAMTWFQADAEALPFASGTFDRVLVGFSTRNLSHLMKGLREMVRVLRPQGRLIILETGYPSDPLLRFGYQLFLLTVARAIGFFLTGRVWPFTYLARSVRQFLTPEQMVERLQHCATQVQYVPLSNGLASVYLAIKD